MHPPIFLTLKANKSVMRIPKNFGRVEQIISSANRKHGVRMYRHANVGNHLHLLIKIPRRSRWSAYIRELTGRLALSLQGKRGDRPFWKHRPHTQIVGSWKKAFRNVLEYIGLNILEADGAISRREIALSNSMVPTFTGERHFGAPRNARSAIEGHE